MNAIRPVHMLCLLVSVFVCLPSVSAQPMTPQSPEEQAMLEKFHEPNEDEQAIILTFARFAKAHQSDDPNAIVPFLSQRSQELWTQLDAMGGKTSKPENAQDDAPQLGSISVNDDRAALGVTGMELGENGLQMVKERGVWKVDISKELEFAVNFMGAMTSAFDGAAEKMEGSMPDSVDSMEDMGNAMGQAMGTLFEAMAEGMTEGLGAAMEQMGDGLGEATEALAAGSATFSKNAPSPTQSKAVFCRSRDITRIRPMGWRISSLRTN